MKWTVLPVFLFWVLNVSAQQLFIKGKVTDLETGEGVSFAHVGICGKSIGTVANDLGEFEFHIPDKVLNDSLCATAIGYATFKVAVQELKGKNRFDILLKPTVSYLQNILVKDEKITGKRVVAKAIARIPRNYPKKPFNLKGYYRDYLKKNNQYVSMLEAVIEVDDKGFRKPIDRTLIKINQLRYSRNYIDNLTGYVTDYENDSTKILLHGVASSYSGNEFLNLYYHNPIRNHITAVPFIGVFDTFADRNYDFKIEYYTTIDGKEVYVINISTGRKFKFTHVSIKGQLFIRTDNYAIVKFNYAYFVTKRLETKKLFELNVEYREFQDKMYLKYFSYMNYFQLLTLDGKVDISLFREFFINKINAADYTPIDKKTAIDITRPLYLQEAPNDAGFWLTYNRTLLEQPLME